MQSTSLTGYFYQIVAFETKSPCLIEFCKNKVRPNLEIAVFLFCL